MDETPIILEIFGEDTSERKRIPLTSNVPKHHRIQTRAEGGQLVLRISEAAVPKLVEALAKLSHARGSR